MRATGRDLVGETRLALKTAVAASLGWWLGTAPGEPRPIFAALVGLVAMSGDPANAPNVSVARILGVFAGVVIRIGVLQLHAPLVSLVALALVGGTLAGIPLRVGDRPSIQAAVSALFLVGLGRSGALHAGVARLWETAIGAGVTLLVSALLWPPHPVRDLRHRLDALRLLRLNPLRRRHVEELELLAFRINLAARLYRHARSIARDVADTRIVDHDLVAAAPAGAALAVHAQLRQMLDDLRAVAFR